MTKQTPLPPIIPYAVIRAQPGVRGQLSTASDPTGGDLLDALRPAQGLPLLPESSQPAASVNKTREEIASSYELGRTSAAMSFHELALESFQEVTRLAPDHAAAWRGYAEMLRLAGRDTEADKADACAAAGSADAWPAAVGEQDADKLKRLDRKMYKRVGDLPVEARMTWLRENLFADPLDVAAMRYLADQERHAEDLHTAQTLLERALELSPAYLDARRDYTRLLAVKKDHTGAYHEAGILLAADPASKEFRQIRADSAVFMERSEEAAALYKAQLKDDPENMHALNAYGAVMKTLGRRAAAENAFRVALNIRPNCGQAYLGLAELRSDHLSEGDVADMMQYLAEGIPELPSRKCMAYALAQTLERMKEYEGAFEAYAFAAKVCKDEVETNDHAHNPDKFEERLARARRTYTANVMSARMEDPPANPPTTPIFVLGMPRAGSTLVEQILASHPVVEGTRELPSVGSIAKRIAMSRFLVAPDVYPERVPDYRREELHALGEDVLRDMEQFRKTTLPYVIDKRPWNWIDIPFLALALPQSKFIDIRRAPMAAGFAMFKQLLPWDAAFTYDLTHLGRYYRSYVAQMDFFNTVMPGRVLHVRYEDLVDNTEAQIRRMLDYCGLPFDERCLRFWENDRAVLTPSAEQVRKPIYRGALEQWKNFEPWLGELKEALGDLANA